MLEVNIGSSKLNQISVDRIDSDLGYTLDNCVLSCLFCNHAKNEVKVNDYYNFITVLKHGMTKEIELKYRDYKENKLNSMINTITGNAYRNDKDKGLTSSKISYDDIINLLGKQNYCCAITGLKFMNFKNSKFPLKMSLDRIDNSKSHTIDNCQLVLLAIQYGKSDKSMDEINNYIKEIRQC